MSYGNNNNQGYGNNGYGASGYGNNGYGNQPKPKKKSGAKFNKYVPTAGKNKGKNQYIVNGWQVIKKELISWKCVTTSKSKLSDKGWMGSVACERVNQRTGETGFFWGTMEQKTGKVVIDKLQMVINPKARNGGYCGTYRQS